jgi:hypothetical protein
MLTRLRARLSSAHVIAVIALFFAIAGGSAIALQGKNSVDSGDIRKNAVKSADIAKNAVKSADIAKNAVKTADIGPNAVTSAKIRDGNVGTADLAGAEPFHRVGAPGEPAFSNGGQGDCIWSKLAPPGLDVFASPGFYKDPFGTVRLTGAFTNTDGSGGDAACDGDDVADSTLFTLPPNYRPEAILVVPQFQFTGATDNIDQLVIGGPADVVSGTTVLPAGAVIALSAGGPPDGEQAVIDGVDFRAGSGAAGVRRAKTIHATGDAKKLIDRLFE